MLVVDIVLLLLLTLSLVVGARRGLMASLGLFIGIIAGAVAAYWVMPLVSVWVPLAAWRTVAAIGAGVLLLVLGAALGSAIGRSLRRGIDRIRLRVPERILGGLVSLVAAALALSFFGGALVATGTPVVSPALASSSVLRVIDALTPEPVRVALAQVRGSVLGDGLPTLGRLLAPEIVPSSPEVALDDPALARAAQSVAKITGTAYACGITSSGSGFAVSQSHVVTNAHVVAGVDQPIVELPGRAAVEGRVVYFDQTDDLAVIAVDALDAVPLPVAATLPIGAAAVVQGYPHGGPFTSGAAQVISLGIAPVPDIYEETTSPREIYALSATVQPGNSGGPLLTAAGEVAGVVFARSDVDADTGYAMTPTELAPVLAQLETFDAAVPSGACAA